MELGVRVCRSAGYYDHALALAARHGLHHHHLAILIDDKKDYSAALRCGLEACKGQGMAGNIMCSCARHKCLSKLDEVQVFGVLS